MHATLMTNVLDSTDAPQVAKNNLRHIVQCLPWDWTQVVGYIYACHAHVHTYAGAYSHVHTCRAIGCSRRRQPWTSNKSRSAWPPKSYTTMKARVTMRRWRWPARCTRSYATAQRARGHSCSCACGGMSNPPTLGPSLAPTANPSPSPNPDPDLLTL